MDSSSDARLAFDRQLTTHQNRPLPHAHRAQTKRPRLVGVEPAAIVPDHQGNLAAGPRLEDDSDVAGSTVHPYVGQSLFNDSVEIQVCRAREDLRPAG